MVRRVELLITTLMLTAMQPVLAQGMEAGAMQTMTPSSSIGPEQDSLLPPEVVPIDPGSVSQVQSRQAGMSAGQTSNVPGLMQSNPMDMRRQALSQLTGDQTTIPPAAMKPWRAGQLSQPAQAPGFAPGQMSASMPPVTGMPQGMMPPGIGMAPQSQPGGPNYQMANNQSTSGQGYIAQSQTLTGGSQNQPQQTNTRRGGFSNAFSAFTSTGLGAIANPFMSGLMMAGPFTRF